MRLTNSVQKIALEDKLSKLRPLLDVSIRDAGFDPADYADVQGLIDILPGMMPIINDVDDMPACVGSFDCRRQFLRKNTPITGCIQCARLQKLTLT